MFTEQMIADLEARLIETETRYRIKLPDGNETILVLCYEDMEVEDPTPPESATFKLYRFKDIGGAMYPPFFAWTAMTPEAAFERLSLNADENGIKIHKVKVTEPDDSKPKQTGPGSGFIQ